MREMSIAKLSDDVPPDVFGHKASWVSWLSENGFRTPESIFLKAIDSDNFGGVEDSNLDLKSAISQFRTDEEYNIAIRSSATCEDTAEESLAGHFDTFIGTYTYEEVISRIESVISDLDSDIGHGSCRMGVILQEPIDAACSGVVFSTNPLSRKRSEAVISVVEGMGEGLVSGERDGTDIYVVSNDGDISISQNHDALSRDIIEELYENAKEIESELEMPVDIEWCIDKEADELYYLQCRPAADISSSESAIIPISLDQKNRLPKYIRDNDKISSRLESERNDVFVTDSYAIIVDCAKESPNLPDFTSISPSKGCEAYTAVLIHPETVSGEVKRSFLPSDKSTKRRFEDIDSYEVISSPDYQGLEEFIGQISRELQEDYWELGFVVQEIFDAKFTGIVQKLPDGYLIEVGYGHFIPKGVISTAEYILDDSMEVIEKNEPIQRDRIQILEGYIVESNDFSNSRIRISHQLCRQIIKEFEPFLDQGTALEFGVITKESERQPFLIDYVSEDTDSTVDTETAKRGVVSHGQVTGEVIKIDEENIGESVHSHYYDELENRKSESGDRLFYAKRPDISLLELLEEYSAENMGFIFEEGSVLAHLCIVLRERGVPAIMLRSNKDIESGEVYTIDTKVDQLLSRQD